MKATMICKLQEVDKIRIQKADPSCAFAFYDDITQCSKEEIEMTEILFGNIPTNRIGEFNNLKWYQLASAGYERFDGIPLPPNAILTSMSGAYGIHISEYMIGSVLSLFQNFHRMRDNQSQNNWKDEGMARNIIGSICAVVGTGNIGTEFAKRLKLLGAARVVGFRRNISECPKYFDEVRSLSDLKDFLPEADIVGTSLPASPESTNLFDRETIACFKKTAVFINVGRGSAVDLDALCDALDAGNLWGATIDVTDPEPLPADHKAWKVQNLVITPHISGGFREPLNPSIENCISLKNIIDIFFENLQRYKKGEALRNTIQF